MAIGGCLNFFSVFEFFFPARKGPGRVRVRQGATGVGCALRVCATGAC